jgi:hypothetical protein
MRYLFLLIVMFIAGKLFCQDSLQLSPPLMKYESIFFKNKAKVSLLFAQEGATIHYTTNGKTPTVADAVYTQPITITKSKTIITANTFAKNYLPSDEVRTTFIKEGLPIKEITFSEPHKNYKGSGATTLIDNKGGFAAYTNNTWLGFNTDSAVFTISLTKPTAIKKILFNVLQDFGSWIFFPEKAILIAEDKKTGNYFTAGVVNFVSQQGVDVSTCKPVEIVLNKKMKTDKLQLKLYLLKQIPSWHSGNGQRSWIFIDEIKVY